MLFILIGFHLLFNAIAYFTKIDSEKKNSNELLKEHIIKCTYACMHTISASSWETTKKTNNIHALYSIHHAHSKHTRQVYSILLEHRLHMSIRAHNRLLKTKSSPSHLGLASLNYGRKRNTHRNQFVPLLCIKLLLLWFICPVVPHQNRIRQNGERRNNNWWI